MREDFTRVSLWLELFAQVNMESWNACIFANGECGVEFSRLGEMF